MRFSSTRLPPVRFITKAALAISAAAVVGACASSISHVPQQRADPLRAPAVRVEWMQAAPLTVAETSVPQDVGSMPSAPQPQSTAAVSQPPSTASGAALPPRSRCQATNGGPFRNPPNCKPLP